MIDLSLSLWLAQLRPPTTNLQIRKVKDIVHVQMWSFFIVVLVSPHFLTPCLWLLFLNICPPDLQVWKTKLLHEINHQCSIQQLRKTFSPSSSQFRLVCCSPRPIPASPKNWQHGKYCQQKSKVEKFETTLKTSMEVCWASLLFTFSVVPSNLAEKEDKMKKSSWTNLVHRWNNNSPIRASLSETSHLLADKKLLSLEFA